MSRPPHGADRLDPTGTAGGQARGLSRSSSVVRVDAGANGWRADAFLARHWDVSVGEARRRWAASAVRLEGRPVRKGDRLVAGSAIELEEVGAAAATGMAGIRPDASLDLPVLYQDAELVAVDKPAGVPSHPLRPGEIGTAASAIVARFPECAQASVEAREGGLVHRLDVGTSGVLVAARSRSAWTALRHLLGENGCEKEYLAEVEGHPPPVGHIEAPIGRAGRGGGTVRVGGKGRHPLAAETRWRVVRETRHTALVVAELQRGRPHQVRAHLAAAGFPIVGDTRYGARHASADGAFHLHASLLRFVHPVSGEPVVISAPPPGWAEALLAGEALVRAARRRGSRGKLGA